MAYSTSRSVMIPMPFESGSTTTAEPIRRADIICAACRSVCSGPTTSTSLDIASRTCIGSSPLP